MSESLFMILAVVGGLFAFLVLVAAAVLVFVLISRGKRRPPGES